MSSIHARSIGLVAMLLLAMPPALALAQARLVRGGVTLYWGLVPAAVVAEQHALDEMHGVVPRDGEQNHHLVTAVLDDHGRAVSVPHSRQAAPPWRGHRVCGVRLVAAS